MPGRSFERAGAGAASWLSTREAWVQSPTGPPTLPPYQSNRKSQGHLGMKRHLPPMQLALPLDCSALAPCDLPQNPEPSKRQRSRFLQARLEANLAMLARLDTVPGSFSENSGVEYFRQCQRFVLTSSLSSLITEVNGKRWPHVATLPPLKKGADAKSGESRAPF